MKFVILNLKSIGPLKVNLDTKKSKFTAKFLHYKNKPYKLNNKDDVQRITEALNGDQFEITNVNRKEKTRYPAHPFTTSTLQQEAARKLNFKARKTMMLAQQLYEGIDLKRQGTVGLITYMRTDSTRIQLLQNQKRSNI